MSFALKQRPRVYFYPYNLDLYSLNEVFSEFEMSVKVSSKRRTDPSTNKVRFPQATRQSRLSKIQE